MSDVVTMVPVADCRSSPSARPVLPIRVMELVASIREVGLRQPINVRPLPGGLYEIRGGGHRHAAFVELKRDTIPAFVRDDDDLRAELAEIDENLIRNELSPAQRAIAMARRKAIYEALHPETAAGVAGGKARQGAANDTMSFAESTGKSTGKSRRTIERDVKRGEEVGPETLKKVIGTSLDEGKEIDALAQLPEAKRDRLIDRAKAGEKVSAKTEVKKDKRETREAELGQRLRGLPTKRYGLIYVDVPRHFDVRSNETGMDRSPENHYPTMTFEELCDLPVESIAADHCILVYWSTAASLLDDLEIMAEWGFVVFRPREGGRLRRDTWRNGAWHLGAPPAQAYRSMQIWDKVRMGMGYWFRDRHEFILIGVRGDVVPPAQGTQDQSLFSEAKGKHSAKPARVAEMIDRLWPNTPKIELFARQAQPGWDVWGFEAPDNRPPDDRQLADNVIRFGQGASIPPDVGVGVVQEHIDPVATEMVRAFNAWNPGDVPPHDPATGEILDSASLNPAGETIPAAEGDAMEPAAVTGQPSVAGGSPSLLEKAAEEPKALPLGPRPNARYPGRVSHVEFDELASPPSADIVTTKGRVDPAEIDAAVADILTTHPEVSRAGICLNGRPVDAPWAAPPIPDLLRRKQ